ncbi:titin homolog isoform X2 [Channa argus]|uniref:titin homolog isoform X2 n=1 Tax=Channa argus TaxID=215402 RepID=UPI00351FEC66
METNYKTLRRPKRKLCYLTNKESPSKQWTGKLTLQDIDGMFDDLESSSHDSREDDIIPPSPLLQTFTSEANQIERNSSTVPQEGQLSIKPPGSGDVLHPARRSLSPEIDIVLKSPFEMNGPIRTSSPIEKNLVVETLEEEDNERALVVPQILEFEEAKIDAVNTQDPECNGFFTDTYKIKDSEMETPNKITSSKATMSNHKNQVAESCKDSQPVKGKTCRTPQKLAFGFERKTRQENTEPPVSALSQDPKLPSPEKNSSDERQPSTEISTCRGRDIKAFLQKAREAEQCKLSCSRALQALVKVPTPPPEREDEFLILEDDAPFIYIPCKTSIRKRQRQKETREEESTNDKDSLTEKSMKERPLETAQKAEEPEKADPKLGNHAINQKMKKNKEKSEVIGNKNKELSIPQDFQAGDVVAQKKCNKKKQRLKNIQSKENEKTEEEYKERDSKESDVETCSQKMGRRTQKCSEVKSSSKSSKDGKQNAKTNRTKSLKKATNGMQQAQCFENMKEPIENNADAEDLSSLSEKDIVSSEAHKEKASARGKANQNKLPVVTEESSSEDSQVLGKRKRKQPGQWWLSHPETTEQTEGTNNQLTLKKSKQNNKKPSAAVPSSIQVKKANISKRRNPKQPVPSSSQNTNTTERKNTKMTKTTIIKGETLDKKKTTDEVFKETRVKKIEYQDQQQDVTDYDLDLVHSSPLDLTQRGLSLSSGNQVFQRVYQHVPTEKRPRTPRRTWQQLGGETTDRRRRKPPGSWWLVNDISEDGEQSHFRSQHLYRKEPKLCKQQKNQPEQSRSSGLGSPKDGNMAVSPKPLGGATLPRLKPKPLSAPKAVKHSLAVFNDIFTSPTETEPAVSSGDTCQNERHMGTAHPTEEVSVFLQNFETPPDSKCQSGNPHKELQSGPSSMIQLEQYEENEDLSLPSSRVHTVLHISDMCGPPLKPLILQPKDEANLREWFKSLWPTVAPNVVEVTPNQFDWYFYQDRAIGFLLDMDCGSACIGRILLGSHMKKPLWVDHSATTVFNLLTSSVNVVINGKESCIGAGQCFTVQCGHAYSIQNMYAQPAVLYFTRILAESSN